jgi:hypothetical protein
MSINGNLNITSGERTHQADECLFFNDLADSSGDDKRIYRYESVLRPRFGILRG